MLLQREHDGQAVGRGVAQHLVELPGAVEAGVVVAERFPLDAEAPVRHPHARVAGVHGGDSVIREPVVAQE